jgi:hypothetical protein
MTTCKGTKGGAACRKPVLTCGRCASSGCANKGCSNCNFPGGKCENCGRAIPFSFFSSVGALFSRREN